MESRLDASFAMQINKRNTYQPFQYVRNACFLNVIFLVDNLSDSEPLVTTLAMGGPNVLRCWGHPVSKGATWWHAAGCRPERTEGSVSKERQRCPHIVA